MRGGVTAHLYSHTHTNNKNIENAWFFFLRHGETQQFKGLVENKIKGYCLIFNFFYIFFYLHDSRIIIIILTVFSISFTACGRVVRNEWRATIGFRQQTGIQSIYINYPSTPCVLQQLVHDFLFIFFLFFSYRTYNPLLCRYGSSALLYIIYICYSDVRRGHRGRCRVKKKNNGIRICIYI